MIYNGWLVYYGASSSSDGYNGTPGAVTAGSYSGQAIAGSPLELFETNMNAKASVIHWGKQWLSSGAWNYYNTNVHDGVERAWADGRLCNVGWGNWQITGGHTPDQSVNYQAILDGTNTFGGVSIDTYLHTWFNQAAVHGKPFFLRMMHEMNAANGWGDADFPWCIGNVTSGGNAWTNSPQQHIDAWNKIYQIAQQEGAYHVTFLWCPNIMSTTGRTSTYTLAQLYPGSSAVHWIGLDGYEQGTSGTRQTIQQIFRTGSGVQDSWGLAHALDQTKPMFIGETGSYLVKSGVDDRPGRAAWYKDTLEVYLPDTSIFPNMYMNQWFMEGYDHNHWMPDGDGLSPSNVDAVQFKNSIGQPTWVKGGAFSLPPMNKPIEPYAIQSEGDPWNTVVTNMRGITARWKVNEAGGAGSVVDYSGNSHTGTPAAGITLGSTGVLPTLPAQTSALFDGSANGHIDFGSSTDYSPTSLGNMSMVTMFLVPSHAAAHWIIALGNTGQYEWATHIRSDGSVETVFYTNAGTTIAVMNSGIGLFADNIPNLTGFSVDTVNFAGFSFTNGSTGNYSAQAGTPYAHGTAHLWIGDRADNNAALLANSRVGETIICSPMLNAFAWQDVYAAWKAKLANSKVIFLL